MLSNQWFRRRRFLKFFLTFMEHNYLKQFEGGLPKEHSCEKFVMGRNFNRSKLLWVENVSH